MDCFNSEDYFMKFMDNTLDEDSAQILNDHIKTCGKCREEFLTYNMMMEEFEKEELLLAPEGFEFNVMEKLSAMPEIHYKPENRMENAFCFVLGLVSALMGIGFMIGFYKDQIIQFFSSYEILSVFVDIFTPISEFAHDLLNNVSSSFTLLLAGTVDLVSQNRFFIIGIILVFAVLKVLYSRFANQRE